MDELELFRDESSSEGRSFAALISTCKNRHGRQAEFPKASSLGLFTATRMPNSKRGEQFVGGTRFVCPDRIKGTRSGSWLLLMPCKRPGLRHLSRGVSNFRHFLRGNLANAKPSAFNWLVVVSVSVRLWQVACTLFGCGRRADIRACYPVRWTVSTKPHGYRTHDANRIVLVRTEKL